MHIIFLVIISVNKWEQVNLIRNIMVFFKIEEKLVLLNYTIASSEAIFVQFWN